MGQYINRFFCMIAAAATSYFVNMVYELNTAFAWESNVCKPQVGSGTCQTVFSHGYCNGTTCTGADQALSNVNRTPPYGYALASCSAEMVQVYMSARASCWFTSCAARGTTIPTMTERELGCGRAKICGNITEEISCYTGGSPTQHAGYRLMAGTVATGCACCNNYSGTEYSPVDSYSINVYSIYGATAASNCYIVGNYKDTTGLFEYTDDNRCYYAS